VRPVIELHFVFRTPAGKRERYVLVPEMRPETARAIFDKYGWDFDAKTGAWTLSAGKLKTEARILWTEVHEDDFEVVITGRNSWRFVEDIVAALSAGA